jgi:hypothetical protein
MRDFHPLGLPRPSRYLGLLKGTTPLKADYATTVFSVARHPPADRIERRDWFQTAGVGTPHELEFDPVSLRRTGRATLVAPSATGQLSGPKSERDG